MRDNTHPSGHGTLCVRFFYANNRKEPYEHTNMKIRKSRSTAETVDCKYCTEYVPHIGCTAINCIILPERIEAGMVGYAEIIKDTFGHDRILMKRLKELVTAFPGTMWADETHRQRFLYATSQCEEALVSHAYFASVYLITSNEDIYERAFRCFLKSGLYLKNFRIRGISPHNYTLFSYTKRLYSGQPDLPADELTNRDIVPEETFRFAVNAVVIARHGAEVLKITT